MFDLPLASACNVNQPDDPMPNGVAALRLAVGIITKGRSSVLAQTLPMLQNQQWPPARVIVCYTEPADIAGIPADDLGVEMLLGPAGATKQRNCILDAVHDCDIVLFLDDDFLAAPAFCETVQRVMAAQPDLLVATGRVIADGINGPGMSFEAGVALIEKDRFDGDQLSSSHAENGYGCNMAIRLNAVGDLRFDENLPLYGWYEDIDFTRRLGRRGRIARLEGARGVHLGVKLGRTSGLRLGYSQIANPIYLARKGSYPWSHALGSMARNTLANVVKSLKPEPYIDRYGRLRGNVVAFVDLVRGRLDPNRVLDLAKR
jgi:glycosyltransferase involved in cell wall biosynthesis